MAEAKFQQHHEGKQPEHRPGKQPEGNHLAPEKHIFRSKLPDIYVPDHLPLHTYCFEKISEFGTRPCLIDGPTGDVYTYSDVELTSRRVAAGLHRLGLRKGDVVMILLQNSPEFAFAFLGVSNIGAIATMANPFYTPAEIRKQAAASGTKLIVTQACYADKVREFAEGGEVEGDAVKVVCTDAPPQWCIQFADLIAAEKGEGESPGAEIAPEDVVALPYSSGTTGLPKGVMLTHRGLVTSVAQQVDGDNPNLYIRQDDVMLCVLPLFHIYSLNSVLLCGLRAGAAILLMPRFEIGALLRLVERHRVTVAPLVPPIALAISKTAAVEEHDLSSVRMVLSGGAPMGKELEDAVRAKLPNAKLGQGYGMTEAGPVLSMCLGFAKVGFEVKSGSCGTVVRNAEMKIVDPDTSASLPRSRPGEICIRGHQIMKGYLKDPEATAGTIDGEGWLHTGDIGYIDEDDELFIVDRLKELIKFKGFQVAPAELEAMLVAHPHISDAAVVPMKDEAAGEVPVAFVVRSNGTLVSEDDIRQYISKQVVFYKRINRIFFVDTIPKAPSGKILRKDLRAEVTTILSGSAK